MTHTLRGIRQRLTQTYKTLRRRFAISFSPEPIEVLYTGGADLQRSRPKRMFRELSSRNVMLAIRVAEDNVEDACTFVDDVLPMPGAYTMDKDRATLVSPTSTSVQHQPFFYGKIYPDQWDLKLTENDDDNLTDTDTCHSEPLQDTSSALALSTLSFSSFRSLPANWAPGQTLPDFATNHIWLVAMDRDGPVYTTALAPPPPRQQQRCSSARFLADEEPDLCPVHQCSIPCSICERDEAERGPVVLAF